MSYSHHFYLVDLERLRALYGSNDEAFVEEILREKAGRFQDLADNVEDEIEEGEAPAPDVILREIVAGATTWRDVDNVYGYVLEIICDYLGEYVESSVHSLHYHPYSAKLIDNGVPVSIPYGGSDFPEIGYLALEEISGEIARIEEAPREVPKTPVPWFLKWLIPEAAPVMSDEAMGEEMDDYKRVLTLARDQGKSLISFQY